MRRGGLGYDSDEAGRANFKIAGQGRREGNSWKFLDFYELRTLQNRPDNFLVGTVDLGWEKTWQVKSVS